MSKSSRSSQVEWVDEYSLRNFIGHDPVITAIFGGDAVALRNILEPDRRRINAHPSPLLAAIEKGDNETVQTLIANKADIHLKDPVASSTPLHWAARWNQQMVIRQLHAQKAALDLQNKYMQTPLHVAALAGAAFSFETLLSLGASRTEKDQKGLSVVELAMLKKDPTILRLLKLSPVAMESIPVFPALSSPTLEETGGIGVAFARNGANETIISAIMPGGPADKSKQIKVLDVLLEINGQLVDPELGISFVCQQAVGPVLTDCDLKLRRGRETFDVKLKRQGKLYSKEKRHQIPAVPLFPQVVEILPPPNIHIPAQVSPEKKKFLPPPISTAEEPQTTLTQEIPKAKSMDAAPSDPLVSVKIKAESSESTPKIQADAGALPEKESTRSPKPEKSDNFFGSSKPAPAMDSAKEIATTAIVVKDLEEKVRRLDEQLELANSRAESLAQKSRQEELVSSGATKLSDFEHFPSAISDLTNLLLSSQELQKKFEKENTRLLSENGALQLQLNEKQGKLAKTESENMRLMEENSGLLSQLKSFAQKEQSTFQIFTAVDSENAKQANAIAELTTDRENLKNAIAMLSAQIISLTTENRNAAKSKEDLMRELLHRRDLAEAASQQLQTMKHVVESMSRHVLQLERKVSKQRYETEVLSAKSDDEAVKYLKRELEIKDSQLEDLSSHLKAQKNEKSSFVQENSALRILTIGQKKEIEALKEQLDRLAEKPRGFAQIVQENEELWQQTRNNAVRIATTDSKLDAARHQFDDLVRNEKELKDKMQWFQKKVQTLESATLSPQKESDFLFEAGVVAPRTRAPWPERSSPQIQQAMPRLTPNKTEILWEKRINELTAAASKDRFSPRLSSPNRNRLSPRQYVNDRRASSPKPYYMC